MGYIARIEFDERDAIFVGRVLGVKAIIGFHGETVAELRTDFEAAIDFMIDDCKARGETPEKSASGSRCCVTARGSCGRAGSRSGYRQKP
jgi:predicted HicB family RNase H-like nuclease